jgi:hypothetical protein
MRISRLIIEIPPLTSIIILEWAAFFSRVRDLIDPIFSLAVYVWLALRIFQYHCSIIFSGDKANRLRSCYNGLSK